MLEKSYITMDVIPPYEETLQEMQRIIKELTHDTSHLAFTHDLHLTLDFLGRCNEEIALQKLQKLEGISSKELAESIASLRLGKIKSFLSNANSKRVFYLEVTGGEAFFKYIQTQGYTITTPHITLCTTANHYTESQAKQLLETINNHKRLAACIARLHIDTTQVVLKNKVAATKTEIIETLVLV